jgi:hypothetical protein
VEQKYIEIIINRGDRTYKFMVPEGSPIGETYDAAFDVLQYIIKVSQEAAEKAKPIEMTDESSDDAATEEQATI